MTIDLPFPLPAFDAAEQSSSDVIFAAFESGVPSAVAFVFDALDVYHQALDTIIPFQDMLFFAELQLFVFQPAAI